MTGPNSGIFLFSTISLLAILPGTAFACAENDINCWWNLAETQNRLLDQPAFSAAVSGARRALANNPDASPTERAAVLRLEGIEAAMQQDRRTALRLFQEARRLDATAALPADLYPPAHPFAKLYAAADPTLAPLLVEATPPMRESPPVTTATVVLSETEAPARRRAAPWFIGAATSAMLSGGLYAWSRNIPEAVGAYGDDAMAYATASARAYSREDGLRTASGGAALLGAGLLTAGLTVAW